MKRSGHGYGMDSEDRAEMKMGKTPSRAEEKSEAKMPAKMPMPAAKAGTMKPAKSPK